ncbi:MAG: peptidase T [Ignavibacteria bacterium]|nr:peptidase T [Ignavibacteria bacterium]
MSKTPLERFISYAKINTQSSENNSNETPSTRSQFDLANLLVEELKEIGIDDAEVDEHCYVMATIPSNLSTTEFDGVDVPYIGFLAHLDTSPEVSGEGVNPQIIENYDGGDIVLPKDPNVVIRLSENPLLSKCIGHTIVTSDGTTLLGADNKAGIAAIMSMAEYLQTHPDIPHGTIRICFTPDEEIGNGTKYLDLDKFNVKYAYTVDGDLPGELNKETFSADQATITIIGRDIHPGTAKGIMVNSIRILADIIARLPKDIAPETTEGYQPYIHPYIVEGGVGKSTLKLLLRDFRTPGLDELKKILEKIVEDVKKIYPKSEITIETKFQYRNMHDELEKHPEVLENMWEAVIRSGIEPYWKPIRGGTDGARLTEKGIPTPNIFTGGTNFHSKTEWLSVNYLNKTVETLVNLVQVWVEKSRK